MRFMLRDAHVEAQRIPHAFKATIDEQTVIGAAGDYVVTFKDGKQRVMKGSDFERDYAPADDPDPFSDELRKALADAPMPREEDEDDGGCVAPASDAELERQALAAKRAAEAAQ